MRIHALEATCGLTYARDGLAIATADGKAARTTRRRLSGQERPAGHRTRPCDIWVTETALTTALNVKLHGRGTLRAVSASSSGIALLLAGIGFIVLDYAALHRRRAATEAVEPAPPLKATTPAMV